MLNKQVKHFDFSLSFLPPSFSLYNGLSFFVECVYICVYSVSN